jgi:hypothetical protein
MAASSIQPVATLREEDGFVLGIFESGSSNCKFASYVVRRRENGQIRDHFSDLPESETGQKMVGWMHLPYSDADVQKAIEIERMLAEPEAPSVLQGDIQFHFDVSRHIVFELAGAIGPRRALIRLHNRLGDKDAGPRLPKNAPEGLRLTHVILAKWSNGDIDDAEALRDLRKALLET